VSVETIKSERKNYTLLEYVNITRMGSLGSAPLKEKYTNVVEMTHF